MPTPQAGSSSRAVRTINRRLPRHRHPAELPTAAAGREPDPVEAVSQSELVARVRAAVSALPPADQHLLGLRYLDSQIVTRAGAAAVLGVSVTRVAQVERRALDRLAAALGGGLVNPDASR
ncbi:MAG: sigma-70 family RNA polymerase sigma factor [Gemmataceae bacterium]